MFETTIERELRPFARPLMRKVFKWYLSRACRDLFDDNPATAELLRLTSELIRESMGILRKGAVAPELRGIDADNLSTASDPLCTPFVQLLQCSRILLAHSLAARHVDPPRLQELCRIGRTLVGWIGLLTDQERAACKKDLLEEKIDNLPAGNLDRIDDTIATWIALIRLFFCRQMTLVAVGRGDLPALDLYTRELQRVIEAIEAKLDESDTFHTSATEVSLEQIGATPEAPIRLALPGLLVVPPISWEQFQVNYSEHFGELQLVGKPPSQADWAWLTEDAHYLITFHAELLIQGTSVAVQYYMRRLVALSRCFRAESELSILQEQVGQDQALTHVVPAQCRTLVVPTEIPKRFLADDLRPTDEQLERLLAPVRSEFKLAGRPFVDSGELRDEWLPSMEKAWEWLSRDASDAAERIRHVIDLFEVACTLGQNGDLPAIQREGWQLVGLMTSIEALLCSERCKTKRAEIDSNGRRVLGSVGTDQVRIDRCISSLRLAYDWRSAFVHAGICEWKTEKLPELRRSVALVLRAAILHAVR